MDDSTGSVVLAAVGAELAALWEAVVIVEGGDLETAEGMVRDGVLAIGARLLEASVAARGTGKGGARIACARGGEAGFEGYRAKQVQTVVGWITIRRADYGCAACGHGRAPLDTALGLARDSHSPGVRRLACRFGARQPFAQAADDLAAAAGAIHLSASTVRTVTEAVGARRQAVLAAEMAAAWEVGLPAVAGAPERLYVAMDGVYVLGTAGVGHEVKVGMVQPVRQRAGREWRERTSYAAGLEPAAVFGQRLALEAHRRGLERAGMVAVLGDGAASGALWALDPGGGALSRRDPHRRLVSRQ